MRIEYEDERGQRMMLDVSSIKVIRETNPTWVAEYGDDPKEYPQELHFNFTHEGLITDAVFEGKVVDTKSMLYEDIYEDMTNPEE